MLVFFLLFLLPACFQAQCPFDIPYRRLETGETVLPSCEKAMTLARERQELKNIMRHAGAKNRRRVIAAAKKVAKECDEGCKWYLNKALEIDPEILESVWIFAFGDTKEQTRGCGQVVTKVNDKIRRRAEAEMAEDGVINVRRLLGVGSAVAVTTGAVMANLCQAFDPVTYDLLA